MIRTFMSFANRRKERIMSDYLISVVDATSAFPAPKENREYQTSNLDDAYDKGWDDCQLYIGTLPPIDAVQVVRCKDCKYYKENTLVCGRYGLEDDDYCSWAERKDE